MFLLHKKRSALDAHSALRENGCLCNRSSVREFALTNPFPLGLLACLLMILLCCGYRGNVGIYALVPVQEAFHVDGIADGQVLDSLVNLRGAVA